MNQHEKLFRDLLWASGAEGKEIIRQRVIRCFETGAQVFGDLGLTPQYVANATGIPFAVMMECWHQLESEGKLVPAAGVGRQLLRKDRS